MAFAEPCVPERVQGPVRWLPVPGAAAERLAGGAAAEQPEGAAQKPEAARCAPALAAELC